MLPIVGLTLCLCCCCGTRRIIKPLEKKNKGFLVMPPGDGVKPE